MSDTARDPPTRPLFCRATAVELLPCGVDDASYRLDQDLGTPLVESVERTLEETNGSVELFCVSRPTYTGVIATATPQRPHNTGRAAPNRSADTASATDTLCEEFSETLPAWIGLVRGPLSLDALGYAPLRTARVVATDRAAGSSLGGALTELLDSNHQRGITTITQLLITTGADGRFEVTLRVGEATGRPQPLGRHALTATVDAPEPDGLARVLPTGLRSSRTLAADAWTTRPSRLEPEDTRSVLHARAADDWRLHRRSRRQIPDGSPADRRRLALLTSGDEYDALLAGQPATALYDPLAVEPTLRLDASGLRSVLAVVPLYSGCRWPGSRRSLAVEPETVLSTPVGSPAPDTRDEPTGGEIDSVRSQPPSLTAMATRWLTEAGCAVTVAPDRTWGEPQLTGAPAGATTPVVIVDPTATRAETPIETAGELLLAANQAVQAGERLFVVTPSKAAAHWATDVLAVPFIQSETATRVATLPAPVTDTRGGIVLTGTRNPPRWTVDACGTRRLTSGDRCLAESPCHRSPASLTYAASRAVVDGPHVTVIHPDGATESYASMTACREQYRVVRWPIEPVRPTFLGSVTVVYRDGHRFRTLTPRRRWDAPCGLDTDLEAAIGTFIDRYTVPSTTPLGRPSFERTLDRWLHHQIPCQTPNVSLGGQLPHGIDAIRTDGGRLTLQHRSWRVPAPSATQALCTTPSDQS
ncbi:hypothetical protein [Halorubrum sp. CSM-61]|uniref:hypothetical protein n=1 Tax=Halorubrum sp. CSM-61 TaxID=2485838 RepID=UPI000F4CF0B8|nr:hypothetical protein [Halorubrum sp. CSM-61]